MRVCVQLCAMPKKAAATTDTKAATAAVPLTKPSPIAKGVKLGKVTLFENEQDLEATKQATRDRVAAFFDWMRTNANDPQMKIDVAVPNLSGIKKIYNRFTVLNPCDNEAVSETTLVFAVSIKQKQLNEEAEARRKKNQTRDEDFANYAAEVACFAEMVTGAAEKAFHGPKPKPPTMSLTAKAAAEKKGPMTPRQFLLKWGYAHDGAMTLENYTKERQRQARTTKSMIEAERKKGSGLYKDIAPAIADRQCEDDIVDYAHDLTRVVA